MRFQNKLLLLFFFYTLSTFSQTRNCGTMEYLESLKSQDPTLEERMEIASSIKYVDEVLPQETYSPIPNILKIKPDILMESDSHDKELISATKKVMNALGGRVIIIPYYKMQSSTKIKKSIIKRGLK